jgi:hypothetical protein
VKVIAETTRSIDWNKIKVKNSWTGKIGIRIEEQRFYLDPKDAVALWRLLMGEKDEGIVKYTQYSLSIELRGEIAAAYDCETEGWVLKFSDALRVLLDADEALALAWTLERRVAEALTEGVKENPSSVCPSVWVLSSRIMLTGDCAEKVDSERLGGFERIFVDRESAMDNVRELLRDLVNESYPESHWENNPDLKVDDILDDIMKDQPEVLSGTQYWTYDGLSKSFEVKLCKRSIEQ